MIVVIEKQNGSMNANTKVTTNKIEAWAWILEQGQKHLKGAYDRTDVEVFENEDEIVISIDNNEPYYWQDWRYKMVEMM